MSAQRQSDQLDRPESARLANDRIAERAERYRFVARVPMLCECSDRCCQAIFPIALPRYRELRREGVYLTAPGHVVDGCEAAACEPEYVVQRSPAARRRDA